VKHVTLQARSETSQPAWRFVKARLPLNRRVLAQVLREPSGHGFVFRSAPGIFRENLCQIHSGDGTLLIHESRTNPFTFQ